MHDRQVVRRRRAALAVLVGLSLVLLTAYFGESPGGTLHAIERGAQEALAPIEEGATRALKPVRDTIGWFGDVLEAKGDNEELRREKEVLQRRLAEAEVAARDAGELRQLVGLPRFTGYPAETEPVTARIIARSPTVWYSAVQIDKGSSSGIREDMPVVAAASDPEGTGGLAGRVVSVTPHTARVILITDAESAVSAQVFPDGANGIVKPEVGRPSDLLLDFIQRGRKVKKGDTVVTSGFRTGDIESLFPRGIPIGTVTKVDPGELELYQKVHVKPFADLRRMNFVQVVTRRGARQEVAEVKAP
ncbi:MAG TPA: rod shape-determining protein MreC [Thermoleophilaceae bacterium]|nr:rod shape-determining protein MreC [Thermoleophilaceae bacterium]